MAVMIFAADSLAKVAERLGPDEVHVWLLPLMERGREPLRQILAAYLHRPPSEVRLIAGPHGRPALAGTLAGAIDFNWSHSAGHALVALARGIAPGIDLECDRPLRALALARRYFTADEAAWLARQPEARQTAAFLDLWTAKEAVLKALGRGLGFGLDRLTITCEATGPRLRRLEGDDPDAWQLHALQLGEGLHATLAWRGGPRRIRGLRPGDRGAAEASFPDTGHA